MLASDNPRNGMLFRGLQLHLDQSDPMPEVTATFEHGSTKTLFFLYQTDVPD